MDSSTTFVASLGSILLEDNWHPNTLAIYTAILQPKSSNMKMLDLSYETYTPLPKHTSMISIVPPQGATMIDSIHTTPISDDSTASELQEGWDSSLFINLQSIKVVTMYGFLMAVKDFIIVPITPQDLPEVPHERAKLSSNY